MINYIIKTKRVGLRNWIEEDIELATKMNADPKVREFFPNTLTRQETINFIEKMQDHYAKHDFCFFAADRLDTNEFIGFIGLNIQDFKSDFTPSVEIGWRLLQEHWGNGFATEGAKACLSYAFSKLSISEIYAVTPILNKKSQHVMKKLGMQYFKEFLHPKLDKASPLRKCVVYNIKKEVL